ncbi:MAG: glycolate oxidase subunit GlcE [Pseudomonadota bacterium]
MDRDIAPVLIEAVTAASKSGRPVRIIGNDSKRQLIGRLCEADVLSVSEHRGIVDYRPDELVITARAGTPLAELEAVVQEKNQTLGFEGPLFNGRSTLGGTLASGLSGPSRPWRGSVRDAVLGMRLISGKGEHLSFGGQVMKNVAGYDVSRLQAGAMGSLGIITEVSLRLRPAATDSRSFALPCFHDLGFSWLRELYRHPVPLTGASWHDNMLYVRFAGEPDAIDAAAETLVDFQPHDGSFWDALRDWKIAALTAPWIWNLDVAPASNLGGNKAGSKPALIDWAGARRVLTQPLSLVEAQSMASAGCGHATLYGRGDTLQDVVSTPAGPLKTILERVKQAMDPAGIFTPGRLYRWL